MEQRLNEARQIMEQRKHTKKLYVRNWRVGERARRRTNCFVTDYVKQKFNNIYCEALCFYDGLNKLYPKKYDLRKTQEYRKWKEIVNDSNNQELAGTVQTLITETTLNEGYQNQNQITRFTSQTVLENNSQESSNTEQSDTGSIDDTENSNQQTYDDNLVLEIPLQTYPTQPQAPPDNNLSVEIPPQPQAPPDNNLSVEIPPQPQAPPDNNLSVEIPPQPQALPDNNLSVEIPPVDEINSITDERIREIIEELRNDPELNDLFNDPQPEITEQDEGIELASLEEEIQLDFEPFDYRMEVELENW